MKIRSFAELRERSTLRAAVADQKHTLQRMVTGFGPDASTALGVHPWINDTRAKVLAGIITRSIRLCPHLGPGRKTVPMFLHLGASPRIVRCKLCLLRDQPRFGPADDMTCDRCSVYSRAGLVLGSLPIGPLLVHFGVCRPCATEMSMVPA